MKEGSEKGGREKAGGWVVEQRQHTQLQLIPGLAQGPVE